MMKEITNSQSTLVKVSTKNAGAIPVWLTLKDAQAYLSMGKNSFEKYIGSSQIIL